MCYVAIMMSVCSKVDAKVSKGKMFLEDENSYQCIRLGNYTVIQQSLFTVVRLLPLSKAMSLKWK